VAIRIKRGDTVEVISGNYRGAQGRVLRVLPRQERVTVAGVNIVKKHQRPVRAGRGEVQPGIIEFEAPIHISNVMPVCPSCGERTRIGFAVQEDGSRARICKKCSQAMDK
jgi:large subunit ribosomal protein L24